MDELTPKISVIVPVYNVEDTLERCMQSIFNQTFQDYEILLIDDGSTDGSGALCDEYADKYSNVRVIHKANEGLGPTRNLGIKESRGEYVYHCDSDDWLKEDLLKKAYEKIVETEADFLVFGYEIYTQTEGKLSVFNTITLPDQILTDKESIRKLFVDNYFDSFILMSACNRLCRKSFLLQNDLYFPALRRSQDMAYSFLLFEKAKKVAIIREDFYCYIIQPGVFKGRSYNEMIDIYYAIYESAKKTFESWGLYDIKTEQKLKDYVCEHVANYSAYAFAVKYKKQWRKNTKTLIRDQRFKELFKYYSNPKKSKFMKLFRIGLRMRLSLILLWTSKIVHRHA